MRNLILNYGFSKNFAQWDNIGSAKIEYDPNLNANYLHLILYDNSGQNILFDFNISHKKSYVFARRHFVKTLLNHLSDVTYVARGDMQNTSPNIIVDQSPID